MSYDHLIERETEHSQIMYRGEWFAARAGPFEVITSLQGSKADDLLIFSEADTGRTLWLRAGQVDAVISGKAHEEDRAELEDRPDLGLSEQFLFGPAPPRECEQRGHRRIAPRHRGDW